MIRTIILSAFLALTNCHLAQSSDIQTSNGLEDDVTFEEVLAEFQDLNSRLEQIAYALKSSNQDLCPKTIRDTGLIPHLISDYPDDIRPVAQLLLAASNRLSIRTIRQGSPADQAGLRPKDNIIKLGNQYLPSGPTVMPLFEAFIQRQSGAFALTYERDGQRYEASLATEKICGYPVNVFFSDHINGHTDGQEIWITSGLMRSVKSDVNLALIIAHEMAHAIAGHQDLIPTKALELEADAMALVMLERAGYDSDAVIEYWQFAPRPHAKRSFAGTHPSMGERLNNFRKTLRDIRELQQQGRPLDFDVMSPNLE